MLEEQTKERIGKSLGRIVSGVAILTAKDSVQDAAMLASWFQQASFDPPMLTVAIKKERPIIQVIKKTEKFVLNLLHTGEKDMLAHFGKGFEPGQNPYVGVETVPSKSGIPILKKSLCFLECQLKHIYDAGDHELFVAEVVDAGAEEEGQPMHHVRRSGFHY